MKRFITLVMALMALLPQSQARTVTLNIVHTSDVHGNCFPYDFINSRPWSGSYARVSSFVRQQRRQYGDRLLLIDNGDVLQGQPSAYYYNFMNTTDTHLYAELMNYMRYDVGNMGNHDVETGHAVYDRFVAECRFPVLGANIVCADTGEPYLKPYTVIRRGGVKVAVLGMISPAIPAWLPETLWRGLRFEDMEATARKWLPIIRAREKPDLVVGVFHAGVDMAHSVTGYKENATREVAERVPGFDIILFGHDHRRFYGEVTNCEGHKVLLADVACNGVLASNIKVTFTIGKHGRVTGRTITGGLEDMAGYEPDALFLSRFQRQYDEVKRFVSEKIGNITSTISTRPAYFGSSAFIDLTHQLQLQITGAQVSFAAPLSFDAEIKEGDIHISDMFNLMKYENMLYVMRLTGKEIKDYLEYSYDIWTARMSSPDDHLLLLKNDGAADDKTHAGFQNPSFNFDSAAGIAYTVDVTKPRGEKIAITSMADGTPFCADSTYSVAVNSYRGNGGGGLLTAGAGIPKAELASRVTFATDKDLRYYMLQYIKRQGTISPVAAGNWRFVPDSIVRPAAERDYRILFPDGK